MKISTFFYNIGQGFRNIWRNKMFSLASLATMTACIFLFGLFYSIGVNFQQMLHEVEEGVAVTVFFTEGLSDAEIVAIGDKIAARPEVAEYHYKSSDEAWEEFKLVYFEGNEEAAASFNDDNPLANDDSYEIYLKDIAKQKELVSYLTTLDGIREVRQSEIAANTLSDFNRLLTYISIAVVVILVAVAAFLISNTITVGISVRKEEIGIMKLIGAKDSFVRAPFIVEGITLGLIGSVIPLVILWFLYNRIIVYVSERFMFLSSLLNFVPVEHVFKTLVPVALVLGVGIGYMGSRLTLKKHLQV